ncbi:hypothetical protein C0Q70_18640 [Pomacea canaliculata]|uniref:Peptidase M12B domain-containing protein n=1 Tax=Pomacea canaliculata TaxID=400727 RepID=A0A2T7NH31_POMCA|nr:hypothetical protein C0Q70_18640 [Pomacea canaliculata]
MSDTLNVMETTFKERDSNGDKHQIRTERDSTPYYQGAIGQSVNTAVHHRQDYNFWQGKASLSKNRHDTLKQKKIENEMMQKRDLNFKNGVKEVSSKSVASLLTVSCTLHLVADYLFYKHVGKGDISRTVNIMKKTVYGADAIFRSTDFNLDGVGDNIGFMIKNITVLSNESMDFFSYSMDDTNYMGYLRNFSRANFSDYCLGVAFTYKEFKRSVGGVAWIASSNTHVYPGGICQKQLLMKREKAYFSFNSLVISFFNPWHMLNAETAALTLAHELGHSFGSTHDQMTNSKCRYGDPGGHYLMNHYSSTGELPNNYKFSPCSIRLMYPVIAKKGTCFLRYVGNHCGNGVKKKEKNVTVELQEHVSLMTHAVHLLTLHTGAQTSLARIQNGNCPEIFVEAISRLRTLFPTAPLSHLIKTALASTSEDVAVRILLAKGYPMRRFLTKNTSIFSPGGGPENGPHGHQFEQDQQMTNTDQLGFYAPSHLSCQDHPEQPEDKIQHETHRARNKNVSCLEQELTINRHFLVHHFSQSHMQPSDSVQVIHSTDVVYMNLATNSDNIDNVAASSNDGDSDHGSSICGTSVDREPTDFSISISSCSTKHETWLDMSLSAIISTTMSPESGQEASDEQSWFRWFVQKLLDPFRKQEILPETSESCAQCISTSGLKEGESSGIKNMP